jgi:antitoxin (DNA-binding transcriptional repressor) of toxin-antitoxin stability system
LLRGVRAGNRYTITLRGERIAHLVPIEGGRVGDAVAAVDQMRQIMLGAPAVGRAVIKSLIGQGRA